MKFRNKVVIVTGAGHGIGRGVAQMYAQEGANVVLADVNVEYAEETARLIREASVNSGGETTRDGRNETGNGAFVSADDRVLIIPTDVRKPADIEALMRKTVERFGRIDILINNAGVSRWKSPYELTVEEWDDVLNLNLRGIFLCAREAAKVMKTHGGGKIVNLSSTRATMSEPNTEAYAASKGGILALTHALAVSLGPDHIQVNAISPGWIETGDYDSLREIDHTQHPAMRVGKPADIARACLYLTDSENDFITGINLVIDGGMTRKMIYVE